MVIRAGGKRGKLVNLPAPCLDIERVNSIRILGVTINELLSAANHVRSLLISSNSSIYALRVLRVHGIPDESLQEVFRATLLAKITYIAWHGMCSAEDHAKLESLVKRCRRLLLFLDFSMKLTSVCSIESLTTRNTYCSSF